MAEQDDRTEAPTARRQQRARESGQVALSREFVTLAGLGAATALFAAAGPTMIFSLVRDLAILFDRLATATPRQASLAALLAGARIVLPLMLAVLVAAALATFLQTRFLLSPELLRPKFSRLDPRARLKRILGTQALAEAGKALAKLAVVGFAVFHALSSAAPGLPAAVGWSASQLGSALSATLFRVLLWVLGAQVLVTLFDMGITHFRHIRSLRMSRTDIRDEQRETEGDPLIKRRIRQIQQQRARRRMMASVPKATVVLTNPTHYAVALAYDSSRGGAPRVTAKGADAVAARIREVAAAAGVPLVANPPLARALYKIELGAEIPAEHYKLVAEIIAYVWRLKGRIRRPMAAVEAQ